MKSIEFICPCKISSQSSSSTTTQDHRKPLVIDQGEVLPMNNKRALDEVEPMKQTKATHLFQSDQGLMDSKIDLDEASHRDEIARLKLGVVHQPSTDVVEPSKTTYHHSNVPSSEPSVMDQDARMIVEPQRSEIFFGFFVSSSFSKDP